MSLSSKARSRKRNLSVGSQPERHEEEWLHDTAVAPMRYEFQAELWRQSSTGAWHFVTLPNDISDEIDAFTVSTLRGFGSVRVRVTVKSTTWKPKHYSSDWM